MGFNMVQKTVGEVKCVIVGDGGVGKTSMLLSYTTGGIMTDYIPTCFDAYTAFSILFVENPAICRALDMWLQDRNYYMSLIDTAGQETYDRLRTLSYFDTDVFIVCFSVEDPDSFENIKTKWIPEIRQYRPNTPFILVGTQTDLRGSVVDLTNECITYVQGKKAARKYDAEAYLECSALEGQGLEAIFKRALTCAVSPKRKWHFWKSFRSAFKKKTKQTSSRRDSS